MTHELRRVTSRLACEATSLNGLHHARVEIAVSKSEREPRRHDRLADLRIRGRDEEPGAERHYPDFALARAGFALPPF